MPVTQIDYRFMGEIIKLKEIIRASAEGVMEDRLTAAHLATGVNTLVELLEKLDDIWQGKAPEEGAQTEQPEVLVEIDHDLIGEVVRLKNIIKGNIEAVMDERAPAAQLATDVYALVELLDKLENIWQGSAPPPPEEAAAAAQTEQPSPEGQQ